MEIPIKTINESRRVLLIFADSAVKGGMADAELLQTYLQTAADEQQLGSEIYYTYARNLSFFVSNKRSRIYDHRNRRDLKDYDFVYFRKAGTVMQQMLACAVYLHQNHVPYFDTEIGTSNSRNKLSQMFILQSQGLPVPTTLFCRHRKRLVRLATKTYVDDFSFPVIAKATGGTRGDANYLVQSPNELTELLYRERRHFLIQAYIPNDGDYRALVVYHRLRGLIKRVGVAGSHLNNTSKQGAAEWLPIKTLPSAMIAGAERAAALCGRDIAGVDLIIHKQTGEYSILEVNRAPQVENASYSSEKATIIIKGIDEAITNALPKTTKKAPSATVGQKELISIQEMPELGHMAAKVDTGAYSNSLHVEFVEEKVDETGNKQLQYSAAADAAVLHTTNQYRKKVIKSSNGQPEVRYIVNMHVTLGKQQLVGQFSLTDRGDMRHPVLIGRRFLRQHGLLVDVSKRYTI